MLPTGPLGGRALGAALPSGLTADVGARHQRALHRARTCLRGQHLVRQHRRQRVDVFVLRRESGSHDLPRHIAGTLLQRAGHGVTVCSGDVPVQSMLCGPAALNVKIGAWNTARVTRVTDMRLGRTLSDVAMTSRQSPRM